MADMQVEELLGSCALFEGLSGKELKAVKQVGKEVTFGPGKEIVKQGETGVGFHLIVDGRADVVVDGGKVAELGPGQYFGEMSLLDGGPRSATVRTTTDVRTFSLPAWDFTGFLDQNPSIARKMLAELSKRLRAAESSHTH